MTTLLLSYNIMYTRVGIPSNITIGIGWMDGWQTMVLAWSALFILTPSLASLKKFGGMKDRRNETRE